MTTSLLAIYYYHPAALWHLGLLLLQLIWKLTYTTIEDHQT